MTANWRAVILLIVALALPGCDDGSSPPFVPAVAGPSWTIAYSPSMPPEMSERAGDYFFDFPTAKDGIDYVIKRAPTVQMGQTLTMEFSLEGTGKLLATEGASPAKVRLFMQRKGDTLTAQEPYKRWWSRAFIELTSPGTFTLTTKVEPEGWSSVFGAVGKDVPTEFIDCVSNLAHLGFTFGGDFAGHGVYVTSGAVRFVLKEFAVR